MEIERALETQRVKLLRLLTGWFAVVVLLSVGPFAAPRWARVFLDDLLVRAEFAAQCLVRVSAGLQADARWAVVAEVPSLSESDSVDGVPSTAVLIRRMKALRRLLQDLPRYGRRMLRPLDAHESAATFGNSLMNLDRTHRVSPQWIAPGVERPPDKCVCSLSTDSIFGHPRTCSEGPVGMSTQNWTIGTSPIMTNLAPDNS